MGIPVVRFGFLLGMTISFILLSRWCYGQEREMELRQPSAIHLVSDPEGAQVYHGDSLLGTAPLDLPLDRQWGEVRVVHPSLSDWNAVERIVQLEGADSVTGIVRILLPRRLIINSIPYGAEVLRGDSIIGTTPVVCTLFSPETTLTLRKTNYKSREVRIHRGRTEPILERLEPLTTRITDPSIDRYQTIIKTPSMTVIGTAATSVGFGIASVALKSHANRLYDEYRATGNEELLEKTRRYDLYAGISFVVLQAGLAYLVYLLLTE